jgi:hypothetical protein
LGGVDSAVQRGPHLATLDTVFAPRKRVGLPPTPRRIHGGVDLRRWSRHGVDILTACIRGSR